ncbi:MAG: DUF86 domain-containing protein [Candidatus Thermoplasmatota archaeon]
MKRDIRDYIQDVIDATNKSMEFVGGMEFKDFIQDDKTVFAVIRAIEVIGEAVKNIPDDVKEKYPEIPWRNMTGMRNKLIHAYFGADIKRVWKTIKEEIPPLKPVFEKMLKDLEK